MHVSHLHHPAGTDRRAAGLISELAADLADRAAATHHDTITDGLAPLAGLLTAIDRLLAAAVTVLIGADRRAVTAAAGQTLPSWLRSTARRTGVGERGP